MNSPARADGRRPDELRPVEIVRRFTAAAAGSVLVKMGRTTVLCTASVEEVVPEWMADQGLGWVTAEYDMLPGSTPTRRARSRGGKVDGRAQEIQRLIGRCMRAIVERRELGPRTIWLDCDVLEADGGTRTAAVTGAYVCLCDAVARLREGGAISTNPVREAVAAVSVGRVSGRFLMDLDYAEDSGADVDFTVAMTAAGRFVEVQGAAERGAFDQQELNQALELAARGIRLLHDHQRRALASAHPAGSQA